MISRAYSEPAEGDEETAGKLAQGSERAGKPRRKDVQPCIVEEYGTCDDDGERAMEMEEDGG